MAYVLSFASSVEEAESAIKANNLQQAASMYEKIIKRKPQDEHSYNRLMMIYRRQGQFKKEIQVINTAIKNISQAYQNKGQKLFGKNASVKRISNALMKSLGLKSATGNNLIELPIIERWRRRKDIVLKKINKLKVNL